MLRDYQEAGLNQVADKLRTHRKVIFQLATGGGKTITFSDITRRYIERSGKPVLILVHRKELMQQTIRTLYNVFGISAQPIKAGMKHIPKAAVYVGMVESVYNRIKKIPGIGLAIIDEAHILSFAKIYDYLPEQLIVGFTATPITSNKKKPLNLYYEDIVCGIDIPELITGGNLCQNITYAPKGTVDAAALKVKAGEYDQQAMDSEFSKAKHIQNTVDAYQKHAPGTKALVFNCSIHHSKLVTDAFLQAGLNCRHLDSEMTDDQRDEIIHWYMTTPQAILCNVAILTTGFDAPETETIVMNRATLSMPLWLQCCGRGSRPTDSKASFTIIDLGQNAITHGDWCDRRDWADLFHNPPKPGKPGTAPVKDCPQCAAIVPASTRTCRYCGYVWPPQEIEEADKLGDFVIVTKGIDVPSLIEKNRQYKEYYTFYQIGRDLAKAAKDTIPKLTDENYAFILAKYHDHAKHWCQQTGRKYDSWLQNKAGEHLTKELKEKFKKWQPAPERLPSL
jgi:superfamily II DNA or RNA helicase